MALPVRKDVLTLNFPYRGGPFFAIASKPGIDTLTLDVVYRGLTFVAAPKDPITFNATSGQANQTSTASALLEFINQATSGQANQTSDATATNTPPPPPPPPVEGRASKRRYTPAKKIPGLGEKSGFQNTFWSDISTGQAGQSSQARAFVGFVMKQAKSVGAPQSSEAVARTRDTELEQFLSLVVALDEALEP